MSQTAQADLPVAAPDNPVGAELRPHLQANLVLDVALGTSEDAILDAYGLQAHQLAAIRQNTLFRAQLKRVEKQLEEDGASFRLKAAIQAEGMLETNWAMVHDATVPAAVRADLMKATARWGGYDGNAAKGAAGGGAQFSIAIHLGGDGQKSTGMTIDYDPEGDDGSR